MQARTVRKRRLPYYRSVHYFHLAPSKTSKSEWQRILHGRATIGMCRPMILHGQNCWIRFIYWKLVFILSGQSHQVQKTSNEQGSQSFLTAMKVGVSSLCFQKQTPSRKHPSGQYPAITIGMQYVLTATLPGIPIHGLGFQRMLLGGCVARSMCECSCGG